jgi:hypothetical protein
MFLARWLMLTALLCGGASSFDATASDLYDVTIETGMPHLEENLRYAVHREQRCLTHSEVFSVFPVLRHASLADCKLHDERVHDDLSTWTLACTAGHGTTGQATWRLSADRLSGTLQVRLGGKNMTFYQRVTLRRLRECAATRPDPRDGARINR